MVTLSFFISYSGIKHYTEVEKIYNEWEVLKGKNKNLEYPQIDLVHQKDDYVDDLTMNY